MSTSLRGLLSILIGFVMSGDLQSQTSTDVEMLESRTPTLYVVTRSTQKFRIGGQDNPTVGLFTTNNRGQTWLHWGWYYTKCFSVAIAESGNLMYLSCGNGIQKTTDGGETWSISTDWTMTECLKAAINPENTAIVYGATAYGIFKTENGGASWQEKNHGLKSNFTPSVIVDNSNPDVVFAATEQGVYVSRNGAENWKLLGLEGKGIRTIVQSTADTGRLLVGTEDDGVFISDDGGTNWQHMNNGLESLTIYALALDPNNEQTIYAGTFRGGVFKSTDNGHSWHAINNGLTVLDIHALIVDPTNSDIVYCGTLGGGVFMSENGGQDWRFIGLETSQVWDFAFVP